MNVRTKIKLSIIAGVALLSSCQQEGILHQIDADANKQNAYIEFGNYVNKMTRASKTSGDGGFVVGDTMAVWGEQTTGTDVDVIFNNQDVRFVSGSTWTYNNKKLWNIGSTYVFYGVYPYSKTLYTMSEDANRYITIPEYTTPNDPDQQTDLMISEKRAVSPFNTVDMFFHHILSNVTVYAKVADGFDDSGIQSASIKSIRMYNVHSTGHYEQTGWEQNRAVGAWSNLKDYMDIPEVTDQEITKTATPVFNDFLMMPQALFGTESQPKDVKIDVTFKIAYKDGTTSTFIKNGIRLAGINGTNGTTSKPISRWEPNYRYNYILAFNPQISTRVWDADGDGSIKIDPETGDTITTDDDTPYPGTMKYSPDEPDTIYIYEDTDGDGVPDTWVDYPIVWEDIDDDGLLEGGIDRDGDGHIDNVDNEDETQQEPGGDTDSDPTDGSPSNPDGKDVILVHVDTDGDGDVDDDDDWVQLQKDPDTGKIEPDRQIQDATIEFTATVHEWEDAYTIEYNVYN